MDDENKKDIIKKYIIRIKKDGNAYIEDYYWQIRKLKQTWVEIYFDYYKHKIFYNEDGADSLFYGEAKSLYLKEDFDIMYSDTPKDALNKFVFIHREKLKDIKKIVAQLEDNIDSAEAALSNYLKNDLQE
jgi:hypothetical protein